MHPLSRPARPERRSLCGPALPLLALALTGLTAAGCAEPGGPETPNGQQIEIDQGTRFDGSVLPSRDGFVARPDAAIDAETPPDPDPRRDAGPGPRPDRGTEPDPDPDAGVEPTPDRGVEPMPDMDVEPTPDAGMDPLPPDPGINRGWVGGPCTVDADCAYEDGFCLRENEGYPRGTCSIGCERFCPDRDGMPVTFCVDDIVVGSGACVQRCDAAAFGGNGCRPGYFCGLESRYNEPAVQQAVCQPGEAQPVAGCLGQLVELGVSYTPAGNARETPDGVPNAVCDVVDAVRVSSPINGVTYRYVSHDVAQPMYGRCELAQALYRLSAMLQEFDIVEVGHIGTYNCRAIAGTNRASEHGNGTAIDLAWFRRSDGLVANVEQHWEHDTVNFQTERGRLLYEIGQQMYERRIFNIVLTPNYNAAHDNHFHVDLTPGSHFIGSADDFEAAHSPACGMPAGDD